jgi:ABC-2 type transport system permease protein
MRALRLILRFLQASWKEETMYRANFGISLLNSLLNLATGVLGIQVVFGAVQTIQGWDQSSTLALLGVYLTVSALRSLFIGPSLDSLAGMDGEIWSGAFDFTVLRPVNTQFLASFRKWRLFSFFDLLLGVGVLAVAILQLRAQIGLAQALAFLLALAVGIAILYAILLAFAALVFWSPGVLFTWIFNGLFQLARYPLGVYPGWLRLVLTWVVPVGVITTFPVQALLGLLSPAALIASLGVAVLLNVGAALLFHVGLRRYASASS